MELKRLKTKYEGHHCKDCGKELKKEEEIYFDPETKNVYCLTCGKKIQARENAPVLPDDLSLIAKIDDLSLKIDHFHTVNQVVLSDLKSIQDKLKIVDTDTVIQGIKDINKTLSEMKETIKNIPIQGEIPKTKKGK